MPDSPARSPASVAVAYFAPYLAYVALGSLADARSHAEWVYAGRALLVGGLLAFFWSRYLPLRGPRPVAGSIALGAVAGLGLTAVWVLLKAPFGPAGAPAWTDSAWAARALVSTILPPVVEELLFRGFALRTVLLFERARRAGDPSPLSAALDRGSLEDVAPGAWSALAVGVSSALFALGHLPGEWPAALAYGAAMCALWIARGDLVSCISAHAVTNAALAVFVRVTGSWGSW